VGTLDILIKESSGDGYDVPSGEEYLSFSSSYIDVYNGEDSGDINIGGVVSGIAVESVGATQAINTDYTSSPTIGAGNDGKHRIGLHVGGGGGFVFRGHGTAPGTFATFGLPAELPRNVEAEVREVLVPGEERVVEREVEVERIVEVEKIVEVQVPGEERVVEVEVEKIVEVEKEVEIVTTEQVISPISYVAIGLGVVLVVVSGVLYQRSKN